MRASLYIDRNTALHRLHPVTKMVSLVAFLGLALAVDHPQYTGALFVLLLVLMGWARALGNLRQLWVLLVIFAVVCVVLATLRFRGGGEVLFTIAGRRFTGQALLYGIGIALRIESLAVVGLLFVFITRVEELIAGLPKLGVPFVMSFAFSLAFRLVPMFLGSMYTIVQAQRSRGLDAQAGNIMQRARKYVPLIVPVFVSAIRNAEPMSMALEARGFGASKRRTSYLRFAACSRDLVAGVVLAAAVALVIWLRSQGLGTVQ